MLTNDIINFEQVGPTLFYMPINLICHMHIFRWSINLTITPTYHHVAQSHPPKGNKSTLHAIQFGGPVPSP